MPKIGKPVDDRPYVLRCTVCGCWPLRELHERFNYTGRGIGKRYDCADWKHWPLCSDENRDGCKPERVHCICRSEDENPECLYHGVQTPPGSCTHPRGFTWADDGMGHSGAVCGECGELEPPF